MSAMKKTRPPKRTLEDYIKAAREMNQKYPLSLEHAFAASENVLWCLEQFLMEYRSVSKPKKEGE